ncbi:MAG: hypothetical protein V2B20_26475 [Pseudomonadota bacterium]
MNQLLIIKAGLEYVRFVADEFQRCPLSKASVFPLAQVEEAKRRCRELSEAGHAAELMKLTIVEKPYRE